MWCQVLVKPNQKVNIEIEPVQKLNDFVSDIGSLSRRDWKILCSLEVVICGGGPPSFIAVNDGYAG
jgi:hypothetical protein